MSMKYNQILYVIIGSENISQLQAISIPNQENNAFVTHLQMRIKAQLKLTLDLIDGVSSDCV